MTPLARRLLYLALFSLAVSLFNDIGSLGVCLLLAFLLLLTQKPTLFNLRAHLTFLTLFLGLLWLTTALTLKEGLSIDPPGVLLAAKISIKIVSIWCAMMALLKKSTEHAFLCALTTLHCPPLLLSLLALSFYQIRRLSREIKTFRQAILTRAYRVHYRMRDLLFLAQLLSKILVDSLTGYDQLKRSLLARGFKGTFFFEKETPSLFAQYSGIDVLFALWALALTLLMFLRS